MPINARCNVGGDTAIRIRHCLKGDGVSVFVQAWSLPPDRLVCSSFQEFQPLAAEALASFAPKASRPGS
eukprot:11221089-Lingulodinium_polyedra.AAC.1